MKIIFFGTPDYVLPIVEHIYKHYHEPHKGRSLTAVVTQPPRPAGRKQTITHSPVDNWAYKKHIQIITDISKQNLPEADIGVLAAYGEILPKEILNHFKYGILNIHPSLLPKYRGASPVQAAIAMCEKITGATVMKMDEKMDHGPIVSQFKEGIVDSDTTESLRKRLFERSAQFLVELIPSYIENKIRLKPQDESDAIYTSLVKKEHGFISPNVLESILSGKPIKDNFAVPFVKKPENFPLNSLSVDCFVRAMQPWPQAWSYIEIDGVKKRIKILKSHIENGIFVLDEVKLEGKNPVSWNEFLAGHKNLKFN